MSDTSSEDSQEQQSLSNVCSAGDGGGGDGGWRGPATPATLTPLPASLQPDVVTKYKAASKIVNGEHQARVWSGPSGAQALPTPLPHPCRCSGGRHRGMQGRRQGGRPVRAGRWPDERVSGGGRRVGGGAASTATALAAGQLAAPGPQLERAGQWHAYATCSRRQPAKLRARAADSGWRAATAS